jgi:N-acetylmuramoyl-L-alanine amidase-like protein
VADIFPGARLMQITQWGYPRGSVRPAPNPGLAYSVLHITANATSTAEGEATFRINNPAVEVGATFFVNTDGSIVQCYADPRRMDPWTNGGLNGPDLTNPRIAAVVRDGVNPNERSLITIELCGREPTRPITAAQEATAARLIAWAHALIGMPVNRETVVGHYQFDRVNRANCPSFNKAVIDRIVALAQGAPDSMTIVTYTPFPEGARKWTANTSKVYTGYKPDGSIKQVQLNAGSNAPASGTAVIQQNPQKAPNGSGFVLISVGTLAGYYMVPSDGTVAAPPPPVAADCSALEARVAELEAQIVTAREPAEQTVEALK